jgi:hypothetical protein
MRPALYVLLGVLLVPTVGLVGDIVTDGRFKSTMSTGAPLQVASDDMVVNLNADMVDGVEGTNLYTRAEVDALVAAAGAADSRRWFYLTTSGYNGAEAATACDSGFHMASIYEILDVSNLRYDTGRGTAFDDSGQGPPEGTGGWVRTGSIPHYADQVGISNCWAWTSSDASWYGTSVLLAEEWNAPATWLSPWKGSTWSCQTMLPVWCIED